MVQVVNYFAPFLILVYLTRTLGVELYGVVAFSIAITQVAYIVLDLGFTLSATRKISVWRRKKALVARYIGAIYSIKLIAFVLVAIAVITYAMLTVKYEDHRLLIACSLLPLLGSCWQPVWFFAGIESMRLLAVVLVAAKLLSLCLIVVFVSDRSDYFLVPVADGIAQITATLIAVFLLYRVGYFLRAPRLRDIRYAFRMTSGFFGSRVSATTYLSSGVFLLGLFAAPAIVAVYALADQLYRAMQSIFAPVAQAIYPYMAKEKDLALLEKITAVLVALAVVGAVSGFFLAPVLVPVLFGSGWTEVIPVLNIFLVAIAIHVLNVLSGYPLAAALGKMNVANTSVILGALVYFLGATTLLLLEIATAAAFAWLMIIAEIYVLGHRAYFLWPNVIHFHVQKAQ